jgi:alpha-L-rhamnosidase
MGLLSPEDWRGEWIGTDQVFVKGAGYPPPDNTMPDPWFRKTFDLSESPAEAVIYVASIGYHELYVNGRKVGDQVLTPCATDHRHRARYVTYDLHGRLKPGRNVIGLWLGVSWSIFPQYQSPDKPRSPLVRAQARIRLARGKTVEVVTDNSWKTQASPNTLLGVWDFMHFGGELYDARREAAGWAEAVFDDSGWKPAVVFQPQLTLSAQKSEPNRALREIRPTALVETSPGVYRADLGVNFAGWLEMKLEGRPGDRVEFTFSEREEQPMTHRLHSAYIIGPSGKGTFRNRFNYGVGRWVQITGLRQKPSLSQMRAWLVRTDYERTGGFECDDPLLNRIYQTTLWTFESLSLGSYVVDCPQRERMGYGGDAHATTRTALNNYGLGAFYTKWSEDWRDVQGADGNLPYTAPTYWGGGGPGWSGYCITLPWELYRRYGDTRILEQNYPTIQRWLGFMETKTTDNLVRRWGGEWDFLGDWLWPGATGVNGDTRETLFFNNCYWIYNLQTAARIAEVLGRQSEADAYRQRAQTARAAVHAAFYNAADHSYVNGFPAYLAIALLTEVPPAELRPNVWDRLEREILVNRKGHIHAGITGGAFLFKTLSEARRDDLIYAMVSQTDYPGWGDMLKKGATTFWEDWEGRESRLHSSYLYVGSWFIERLGGIEHPEQGGFRHFRIQPWIDSAKGPRKVQAHYDSLYGRIATGWTLKDGQLHLEVTVPPNTDARLQLPELAPGSLHEHGRPLTEVPEIRSVPGRNALAELRLEPGHYEFDAALATVR